MISKIALRFPLIAVFGLSLCVFTSHQNLLPRAIRLNAQNAVSKSAEPCFDTTLHATVDHTNSPPIALEMANDISPTVNNAEAEYTSNKPDIPSENSSRLSTEEERGLEMDKLIYELVQDEQNEAIRNQFENTALEAIALKTRLDARIDQTMLALEALKNLRRHIENSHMFAERLVQSKVTNNQIKRFVVSQLAASIKKVDHALSHQTNKTLPAAD